ncbi:nucleotidyltransferase family protein [bacterium]|nr:nucleotidyltransferase family protein [bacterium]
MNGEAPGKQIQSLSPELQFVITSCHPDLSTVGDRIVALLSRADFSGERCLFWARQFSLAPLMYEALPSLGTDFGPNEELVRQRVASLHAALKKLHLAALLNSNSLREELEFLETLLSQKGIWYLPLKGPRLEDRIYGGSGRRVMADLDLLVKLADRDLVLDLLVHNGYSLPATEIVAHEKAKSHHLKLIKQHSGLLLELHWYPVQPDRFVLFSERFWSDERLWLEDGSDLSLEGLWLYLIIHHHEHSYGEFKTLIDCAWSSWVLPDQTERAELARSFDLQICWLAICGQLEQYLGPSSCWSTPLNRPTFIQKQALVRLVNIPLEPGAGIYRRKLAARFLVPHLGQVCSSALRVIFPPYQAIAFLGSCCRWKYFLIFIKRLLKNSRFESLPQTGKKRN